MGNTEITVPAGYKKVWDTRNIANLAPIFMPLETAVYQPYTEVEPPAEINEQVTGFNFTLNQWNFIKAADPDQTENHEIGLLELSQWNAEQDEAIADLVKRVKALEGK